MESLETNSNVIKKEGLHHPISSDPGYPRPKMIRLVETLK
jgi:hypothetical protein